MVRPPALTGTPLMLVHFIYTKRQTDPLDDKLHKKVQARDISSAQCNQRCQNALYIMIDKK